MDTNEQETPTLVQGKGISNIGNKCNKEGGKGNKTSSKKKGAMANETISGEDHIVIRSENSESEDCSAIKETLSDYGTDYNVSNGRLGGNDIIEIENATEYGENKVTDDQVDKDLRGEFFVFEKEKENGSEYSETGSDSFTILEKGLTLVACTPDLMVSNQADDNTNEFASSKNQINGHSESAHSENNETRETNEKETDPNTTSQNNRAENDGEEESAKQDIDGIVPTNNSNKGENGEIRRPDRLPNHSRKLIKHAKNRRQVQETVPEIDEANENVPHPVDRIDNEKNDNRGNPINPKTRKHQNKIGGGLDCPIKEDLQANSSQTAKSNSSHIAPPLTRPTSARPDISRLSKGLTNEEKARLSKCGRAYAFVSSIPNASDRAGESRLSFDCDSSTDTQHSDTRNGGFTSIFQRRYTRMELRKALPRKSFFNCHEKAMKDAGLVVEDEVSKRKAERLKAKLERIAREFDPVPSRVVLETAKENASEVSLLVTSAQNEVGDLKDDEDENSNNDKNESDEIDSGDMVDGRVKIESYMKHSTRKKRLHPEKSDHVDCKPLVHYLEYVKDNQLEFDNYRQISSANPKNKPIRRLISLGRAFELRHRGGSPKTKSDDVIVMAAKALRPRSSDASRYYKNEHDKSTGFRGQDPSLRQIRPPSDDKRRQEKNSLNTNTTKDEERAKSELEKKKLIAEEWAMSVSTNTLTKAKIQTLRELGTDDDELTKWWIALRKCHYLRGSGLSKESF